MLILCLGFPLSADASMCGKRNGQEVCIIKLKRSAKNYWEYRAKITIDGARQKDVEIYNCRDRTLTRKGKYPIPYKSGSPGELVCQTFQNQLNSFSSRW
ncbi:MAG: hypothetical protein AAFQ80_05980 [Cyanobacteria bacterium J06621_8]